MGARFVWCIFTKEKQMLEALQLLLKCIIVERNRGSTIENNLISEILTYFKLVYSTIKCFFFFETLTFFKTNAKIV
jgi:hypothetical protein